MPPKSQRAAKAADKAKAAHKQKVSLRSCMTAAIRVS